MFTDYKNLINFCTTKQFNRRQIRWLELLSQYKFKIEYRSEKKNGKADALSRKLDIMKKEKNKFYSILQQNPDSIFSFNGSMLVTTIIIESKME